MIAETRDAGRESLANYDDVIDVRSPAEFADDHAPGAINLPVLDDAERARVGEIYVQQSRLLARRVGAALVARNIARHLDEALKEKPGSWAPMVYCWRGGQRSAAMATVLSQVGWRPTLLAGGYKTYRRRVTGALYEAEPGFSVVLLDGYTGSAKTAILLELAALGVQVLDLEGLAAHRGSLFGSLADEAQPPQKLFETRLLAAVERLDPARPVVVEAESSKIGEINLPPTLWKAMLAAPRVELAVPRPARAAYLLGAYGEIAADPAALEAVLVRLPVHHGRARLAAWRSLAAEGDFQSLAEGLIEHHYDPAYDRSGERAGRRTLARIDLDDLSAESRRAAAERIRLVLNAMETPWPTTRPA